MATLIPARYVAGRKPYAGTGRDPLGNTVGTWGGPVDMPVHWGSPGAMVEPGERNRDASRVEWTLCVPAGTVLTERDRVVWQGEEYDVAGRPRDWTLGPWPNPAAAILIELKKVVG